MWQTQSETIPVNNFGVHLIIPYFSRGQTEVHEIPTEGRLLRLLSGLPWFPDPHHAKHLAIPAPEIPNVKIATQALHAVGFICCPDRYPGA